MLTGMQSIADGVEHYIEQHLVDPAGILYAYIDALTDKPFPKDFIDSSMVPRRAEIDPWAWWTYEDTIQSSGIYLEGLVRKYEVTGDARCLANAHSVWSILRNTYSCSQVFGIGSFLRPYGGYEGMSRFAEPLGTDQASPMFAGLYHFMKYVDPPTRNQITDMLLKTLGWYEQQGFEYFYYKFLIHEWGPALQHAASFYLPAIAWAWQVTGDAKWKRHLDERFEKFERGPVALADSYSKYNVYRSFYWGGDLPVLRECLGARFSDYISDEMLDSAVNLAIEDIDTNYTEPNYVKRIFPQSASPGFKPYLMSEYDRQKGMGFAYYYSVHGGRTRPRLEHYFLCAAAALGHQRAKDKAVELLGIRQRVPEDFTDYLLEDHDALPREVVLYARSTGALLVEFFRNHWMLRSVASR